MLALLPAAVGCAANSLGFTPETSNPACPDSKRESFPGKRIPHCAILALDKDGNPYPDLADGALQSGRLTESGYCLAKYFNGDPSYDPERIFAATARRVSALCGQDRTLIVLIHGFCSTVPETRRAYKATRLQIEHQYPDRKFSYLEVYWDGMYGSPLAIWPEAQVNSKWAGLGLRNLLRRLDPSLPVRVITHSRGASVISSALWNVDLRSTVAADLRYREAQQKLRPPVLPALRVGMLAPAMRAIDFNTYDERGDGAFCFHDRIVLGINPDDRALQVGGLSGIMGTTLGCTPSDFDSVVAPRLNKGHAHAFALDFSGSVEHGFEDYVLRDVFEDEFLPKLLEGDADSVEIVELVRGR